MLHTGDVLDLSSFGLTMHITGTSADTNGKALEMEWEVAPNAGGPPVHIHPRAKETYIVTEGALDVFVDGVWQTIRAGEEATVEPGVPHTVRNATNEPVRVQNTHEPALRFGEYFDDLHNLARSGVISADGMTLRALLPVAVLMTSYDDEIRSVEPPHVVMRMFGAVGRLLGYDRNINPETKDSSADSSSE